MNRPRTLILFLVPSFLCACATAGGTFAPLGPEHPASAGAPEVPITDPSAVLRTRADSFAADLPSEAAVPNEHSGGAYVCPMHAEVTADEPGNCPKCGMKLVRREEAAAEEEHPHEH